MYDVNNFIGKSEIDKINSIIVQLILPKLNISFKEIFKDKNKSLIENIRNNEDNLKNVIKLLKLYFHKKNINNIKIFEIFDLEFNNQKKEFQMNDYFFDNHFNIDNEEIKVKFDD